MENIFFEITDLDTEEKYIAEGLEGCRNELHLSAAKACLELGQCVSMGKTVVTIHKVRQCDTLKD